MRDVPKQLLERKDRPIGRAVVIHNGKVLLFHRRNGAYEYYVFPGGGIDPGETAERVAVRETLEETSCVVRALRIIYTHNNDRNTGQTFVLCEYVSGIPKLGKGTEEEANMQKENPDQFYEPRWYDVVELSKLKVYPIEILELMINDIKNNFADCPKTIFTKISELKQWE